MGRTLSSSLRQSGVIPYRVLRGGEIQVLLVTSRSRGRWIVPKGSIEPGMSAADSAANEAYEEAGAVGEIVSNVVGSYTTRKGAVDIRVDLYLLEVTEMEDDWLEADQRRRHWFALPEAVEAVESPELATILKRLPRWLTH